MSLVLHGKDFTHYRRQIRIKTIQTIYQYQAGAGPQDVQAWAEFAWQAGNDPDPAYQEELDPFLLEVSQDLVAKMDRLDASIEDYLHNWKLNRLAAIDLAILRLAFYEILIAKDPMVPPVAAANEAIEMAKGFSDDRSRKFISGVVGQLLKQVDTQE